MKPLFSHLTSPSLSSSYVGLHFSLANSFFLYLSSPPHPLALFLYHCLAHLASARKQFGADYSPATPTHPYTQTFTLTLTHTHIHVCTNKMCTNTLGDFVYLCHLQCHNIISLSSAQAWTCLEHPVQCKCGQTWQNALKHIHYHCKPNRHLLW